MKQFGFLLYIFERFFYFLKFLPPQLFIEERTKHQKRLQKLNDTQRDSAIKKRLRNTELIIYAYLLIYTISAFLMPYIKKSSAFQTALIVILTLRLIDVIQVNVNISIFDSLKINTSSSKAFIFSSTRSIILALYNFIEIIVIFAYYYSFTNPDLFNHKQLGLSDKFYYSFTTQLNMSSEIIAFGLTKWLAVVQGLISYFFTIIIISRFLTLLPSIIAKHE